MKRSCGSYMNKRPSCLFNFSSFFSFAGFLNGGSLYIYIYIYIYFFFFFFSCCEQCCLFEFPNLAVILKHSHRFINFILILMAEPSPSFVPALMTWAFKKESLRVSNTNSFFPKKKKHTFSVPLYSLFSSSQTLTPTYSDQALILWRR